MSSGTKQVVVSFDAVVKAWTDTRSHPIWISGNAMILVISFAITYLASSSTKLPSDSKVFYGSVLGLVATIIATTLTATYQREYIGYLRGRKPTLMAMFNTAMMEWKFICLGVLLFIPSLVKWILQHLSYQNTTNLFIPYVLSALIEMVFLFLFSFSRLILVDQAVSPLEAIMSSVKFIRRAPWAILWMMVLAGFCSALGVIACGIGFFVTAPIYYLAQAVIYEENRKLGFFDATPVPVVQ